MKKKLLSIILSITVIAALMPAAYALPNPDWGALLDEKTAMVSETDFELYTEGSVENAPFYGAKFEPRGGSYVGMTADSLESYRQLGSYLSYIESFNQGDFYYPSNSIVANNNVITLAGWTVNDIWNVDYDGIRSTLEKLNSYGKPILVRFANEMNVSAIGENPEQYVNVFRTVANMIHEYPNLAAVWSPNDLGALNKPFYLYYPGDEYVDWVGVSCYTQQYFQGNTSTSWKDSIYFMTGENGWATNKVKPIIKFMQEYGINKPLMISEGGVATNADPAWAAPRLRNMMYSLVMKYPQIKMINYFNTRRSNEAEWYDLNDHPYALDIFNEAVDSGAYIREVYGYPRFVFSKAETGDTLIADADGIVNLYTLAFIPKNPDISVNYRIDGTWFHSSDAAPYKCGFDINSVTDGEHTLTIDGAGQSKSYTFTKRGDRMRFGGEPDMNGASAAEPADDTIRVFINRKDGSTTEISFDQPPVIVDGYTLVPLRNIFEGMGTAVNWYGDTKTVEWDGWSMQIGGSTIIGNGTSIDLAVPAQIMNERTMVPLRAVAECTGYTVDWDGDTRTITINM